MILYHFTFPDKSTRILEEGRFLLSPAHTLSSEVDLSGAHLFFLSTARTRYNSFTGEKSVMFELDGTKLKQKYKSIPVHFWRDIKQSETEERFVSNKPTMPIGPYVKSVHIWMNPHSRSEMRKTVIAAKKRNIPVYGYATQSDMLSMQPSRRIPFSELDDRAPVKGRRKQLPPVLHEIRAANDARTSKNLRPYTTLMHIAENNLWERSLPKLDKEAREILDKILTAGPRFGAAALEIDIKDRSANAHYEGYDSKTARLANDMARRLKRLGITLKGIPMYIKESYESQ